MKTSIVISDGIKQVMFTPESEHEKEVLKLFKPSDKIELAIKDGSFYTSHETAAGYKVEMCRGGYLRAWTNEDSVMLVLTPKSNQ